MSYYQIKPDCVLLLVPEDCVIVPESKCGLGGWFGPRMFIHLHSNFAVGEFFPVEIQRCQPAFATEAKCSFSWDKNITFLPRSFLNYCLQKASKPEIQTTQTKELVARTLI